MSGIHYTHQLKYCDGELTSLDIMCSQCGAIDRIGSWNALAEPCTNFKSPLDKSGEKIVAAALRIDRSIIVAMEQPARHHHVLHSLWDHLINKKLVHVMEQGFTTSSGRFVDRMEGAAIARAAGQIKTKHGPYDELYSEDVW